MIGSWSAGKPVWFWTAVIALPSLVIETSGGPGAFRCFFETFGLSRGGFLAGKFWQVFTYAFLHGSWIHLILNFLLLFLLGRRILHYAGPRVLSIALVAGMIAGGLFHLIFAQGILVGASGGGVALLVLLAVLSPESRMAPLFLSAANLGKGILIGEALLMLSNPQACIPGFSSIGKWLVGNGLESWFEVGHACHFGGGAAGFLIGKWVLRPRVTKAGLKKARARREACPGQ